MSCQFDQMDSRDKKDKAESDVGTQFSAMIAQISEVHLPSRSPFFEHLRDLPTEVAHNPGVLGQIHLVYQSAMHATRAAVYHLPHLDSPAMRRRKLRIFLDDDGLPDGDTHHYQLTRAFQRIGAKCVLDDEDFGSADELSLHLDAETAKFIHLAATLYARSLGAWCVVELMSDTWMRALADSLAVHFPEITNEPYFADCFSQGVEERHAEESMEVTVAVLRGRPDFYSETVLDAQLMAEALDGVWQRLDSIVTLAKQEHLLKAGGHFRRTASPSKRPALAPV
jgi:pyrroloquinoline quinone (PQQ) biosynthesis protein C